MSDIDISSSNDSVSCTSRSNLTQQYSASSIENLLKQKDDSKQFMVIKNDQKKLSSLAWSIFGFPAKRAEDGSYQRIIGFASCFNCKDTYAFQSGGSGSTKHLLRHVCSKQSSSLSSENNQEGPMDKFIKSKKSAPLKLIAQDRTTIRDEFTKWICSSIRPFNIVSDPGLKTTLKTIIDICQKYHGSLDIEDLLVIPTTISNTVNQLADHYRSLIRPILIEQAEAGVLTVCPDLWTDNLKKINYLGLTVYFVTSNYELTSFDLCCSRYDEVDKTGESVLQAIRKQLDIFGLLPYMDSYRISFTSDRGANILKALKGHPVIHCFAHRINNILKLAFYQNQQKKAKKIKKASTTPAKKQQKKFLYVCDSSSDSSSSDDDSTTPSPSKYAEANTLLSDLPPKLKEILSTISTCKKLVRHIKVKGLNKDIEELGGIALKQECIVRWLSMSNMLESIDASIEHVRSILSSKSLKNECSFKLNNINTDALKDLIRLISEFKKVSVLVQTGTRPSLHMAYICVSKLERHLNGTDVDKEGEIICIDDRHEGTNFFRKRLIQLLRCKFTFDEKHIAAAVLHPLYRKLTFATTYSKNISHLYIREQLNDIFGLNQQHFTTNSEPVKKKHKSMEDQFADPDDDDSCDVKSTPTTTIKNDELEKYLRMNIEDVYKQPNPLPFWRDHQNKFPGLALLARRLFSIPVTSAGVERQFSSAGLTISQRRSSLDPDTVNDVLFVRSVQTLLQSKPDYFSK
ncbi:unnamed protein product [Rotaria sordida]|uniref:Transposase n=1 Tax=Rotaria sordida TaxID=392033 RepID=A0A815KI57_9BILA|nr:unnamed protein product [Rotaria sordida]CAF1622591.1 unnamed protein product [Rotaria sordida]